MKSIFLIPLLLIGIISARPQDGFNEDTFDTLSDGMEQLSKDITNVMDSKTGALVFLGGNAFNYTIDAAGAASSGLEQAGNFIKSITLEGLENATLSAEDQIKIKKVAMIQALFNAKRQILQTLGAVGSGINGGFDQISNSLANLYNLSMSQINIAVNTTTIFTTETIPNTITWNNIVSSINGAWDATSNSVVTTADSLITTLLSVKEQMHNTLESFDSQEALSHQTNVIADKVNATMVGISGLGATWGVFEAFDNIMGGIRNVSIGMAVIPQKVQLFLTANKTKEIEESVETDSEFEDYELFANEETDDNDKEIERERRASIDTIEDIPMEELDSILKKELEFWSTVNDIFKRQNRMIQLKSNVPK